MVSLLSFIGLAAMGASAAAIERSTSGLNTYAVAAGLDYFGTATDIPGTETSDTAYMTVLNNTAEFGQLTPANYMKWDYTEASQGVFTYTGADKVPAIASANGQKLRCHTLVWYNQLPSWVSSGSWTNATLIAAMQNHIKNLVTHFGSKCYAWDVVNEALNDDGSYRSDIFYDTIGEAYIPLAFEAAAAAAPSDVKLYYNDYNLEYSGSKVTAAVKIVKDLQNRGIRIDGVGLQSHFIVGSTPTKTTQKKAMASFTALGIEVAQTELDIRMATPSTTAKLAQQKTDYDTSVSACVETDNCVGITLWDFDDKYSWVPDTFSAYGYACPWDSTVAKKPAYTGIVSALEASSSSSDSSNSVVSSASTAATSSAAADVVSSYSSSLASVYSDSVSTVAVADASTVVNYFSSAAAAATTVSSVEASASASAVFGTAADSAGAVPEASSTSVSGSSSSSAVAQPESTESSSYSSADDSDDGEECEIEYVYV